jgi:hypothetical protein
MMCDKMVDAEDVVDAMQNYHKVMMMVGETIGVPVGRFLVTQMSSYYMK